MTSLELGRRSRTFTTTVITAVVIVVGIGGGLLLTNPVSGPSPDQVSPAAAHPAPPEPVSQGPVTSDSALPSLAAAAAALPVIDTETPEYSRKSFGPRWADTDNNGCRQRDDILARDLHDVVLDDNACTVLSGTLNPDPYTGQQVEFWHDRIAPPGSPGSEGVQIDHIVSLSAAHHGGAWQWTPEQRLTFANDHRNLLAVDGPTNQSKQDRGPSQWLPQNPDYVCTYVASYTEIVITWDLAVTVEDRDALVTTLTACGL